MRFNAVHPGPLVHVPPRARGPRLAFDRLTTRVEVPEVSEREMPGAGSIPEWQRQAVPVAFHDGSLWVPVSNRRQEPVGPADLAAFLASEPTEAFNGPIPDALYRTPFHVPGGNDNVRAARGEPIEPARMGLVTEDLRDAAQAAARDHAAANLRLRGGRAWARLPGPFAVSADDRAPSGYRLCARPYSYARAEITDTLCDPGDVAGHHVHACGAGRRGRPTARSRPRLLDHAVGMPLPSPARDMLAFAANHGVLSAYREMGRILGKGGLGDEAAVALRSGQALVLPHLPLASIMAIRPEDAAAPVRACVTALDLALRALPEGGGGRSCLARQAGWAAAAFVPLLDAAVPAEDIDALAAAGPPR